MQLERAGESHVEPKTTSNKSVRRGEHITADRFHMVDDFFFILLSAHGRGV